MVKTAGTLIATSVMPFLLPILIIGIIVIFVVVSFIQIISTPPIVFGVGDGKVVQASSSREGNGLCGRTGDQTGTEIWVSDNQGGWLAYYRRDS